MDDRRPRPDQRVASRVARQAALRERQQARTRRAVIIGAGLAALLALIAAGLVAMAGPPYTPNPVTPTPTPTPTVSPALMPGVTVWRSEVIDTDEPAHRLTDITTVCQGDTMTATATVANARAEPLGYAGLWLGLVGRDGESLGRSLALIEPLDVDQSRQVTFHGLPCRTPSDIARIVAEMEFCNEPTPAA